MTEGTAGKATMRAAFFGAPGPAEAVGVGDLPVPVPGPGDALVAVEMRARAVTIPGSLRGRGGCR